MGGAACRRGEHPGSGTPRTCPSQVVILGAADSYAAYPARHQRAPNPPSPPPQSRGRAPPRRPQRQAPRPPRPRASQQRGSPCTAGEARQGREGRGRGAARVLNRSGGDGTWLLPTDGCQRISSTAFEPSSRYASIAPQMPGSRQSRDAGAAARPHGGMPEPLGAGRAGQRCHPGCRHLVHPPRHSLLLALLAPVVGASAMALLGLVAAQARAGGGGAAKLLASAATTPAPAAELVSGVGRLPGRACKP